MDDVKVLILCAGRGRRIGKGLPKSLININGKTILNRQLEELNKLNIKSNNIYLVTGFKKRLFKEYNLKKFNNYFYQFTHQVFSISRARKLTKFNRLLIIYGDILFSQEDLKKFLSINQDFIIGSYPNWKALWKSRGFNKFEDLESFKINSKNKLIEIGNTIRKESDVQGQFMGLLILNNSFFKIFIKNYFKFLRLYGFKKFFRLETTHFLNFLIKLNMNISVYNFEKYFFEFDTQQDLELYKKILGKNS